MLSTHMADATKKPLSLSRLAYGLLLCVPFAILAGRGVLDLVFTCLGFMFLIHAIKHKDWSLFRPAWVKLAMLIWLYLLIRSVLAMDVANNVDRGLFFGRYLLGALAIQWVFLQHATAAKKLFHVLMAIVCFLIFDIYLQYFVGHDVFGHPPINDRLTGPFNDVRVGSVLLMLVFPVICWLMTHRSLMNHSTLGQLVGLGFAVLVVGAIFLTGERMIFLLCLFGLFIASFLLPNQKKIRLVFIGVMSISVVAISWVSPNIVERQIHSSQRVISQFKDSQYGQIWRNAVIVGLQKPLIGVGPRNFREVCPTLPLLDIHDYPIREQCNLHTHNIYLEWFAETGLIGLTLFSALVVLWLKTLLQAVWHNRQNGLLVGFFVFAVTFLWPIKTSASFFTNSVALPFWFMLGWGLALAQQVHASRR